MRYLLLSLTYATVLNPTSLRHFDCCIYRLLFHVSLPLHSAERHCRTPQCNPHIQTLFCSFDIRKPGRSSWRSAECYVFSGLHLYGAIFSANAACVACKKTRSSAIAEGPRESRCVVSVEILPIATQQCINYLYDKSWTNWSVRQNRAVDSAWPSVR